MHLDSFLLVIDFVCMRKEKEGIYFVNKRHGLV